ncbi:MAG: AraC family transcriptional regulator [Lachnospiraceae bacterium]|nr:AraC family transcriptional regulator [Lachnospiraceae bacterium]
MEQFYSCKEAMHHCSAEQGFTIAHLYKEEKTMEMHLHDCYEVYFSISGGKQFLIGNKFYSIAPGDIFVINQYESHMLTQIDKMIHERIVLFVNPDYVKKLSTTETNLDEFFSQRPQNFSHRLSLNEKQQQLFLYYISKITDANGYGHDIIEKSAFMELLVMLNQISDVNFSEEPQNDYGYNHQINDILSYINKNISSQITLEQLTAEFYLSESYICRIFKAATGTTINKYIVSRRISVAKALLADGVSVTEAYERCGFNDYSNFFKAFTKAVGMSPKKYAQCTLV